MKDLTKSQLVLLLILVSVVVSFTTAIVTASLIEPVTPAVGQTIQRVIERKAVDKNEGGDKVKIISEEDRIVNVVNNVSSAVVSVVASKDLPILKRCDVSPFGEDDFFSQFFPGFTVPKLCERGTEKRQVSAGSGFFVSKNGLIVTNRHVVSDKDASYTVVTLDGEKMDAKVLARDPVQDLAILKVDGKNFTALAFGDSKKLKIGQRVIAIGNALGEFQNTVSVGVVSGLSRSLVASGEQLRSVIQTDAAINPGNSGGPLLNLNGEVIGVNTAIAAGAQNIGFALPSSLALRDVGNVKKNGRIIYPFLGVRYRMVDDALKKELSLSVDSGALLISGDGEPAVVAGSPAAIAGLKENDVIIAIDGVRITVKRTLADIIQEKSVGDKISIGIDRGGQKMTVHAVLTENKFSK